MATEDVDEFCLVSHEGDSACLSARLTFRLVFRTVSSQPQSWLHDHQTLMHVDGLVHVPSDCCVIVSLTALQGHSSG